MIEPLCTGRPCLVVGSAPGLSLPDYHPDYITMAANGGADLARKAGRVVDILLTTTHLFRPNPTKPETVTRDSLRDLTVSSVWIDIKNGPVSIATRALADLNVTYTDIHTVNPVQRRSVVRTSSGADWWVSTGVWAACLAIASGASKVTLAGISLAPGHEGMPWDTSPRFHVAEDGHCLRALQEWGVTI